jgi:hypothetical protein
VVVLAVLEPQQPMLVHPYLDRAVVVGLEQAQVLAMLLAEAVVVRVVREVLQPPPQEVQVVLGS